MTDERINLIFRAIHELDELYDIGDGVDGTLSCLSDKEQLKAIIEVLGWWHKLPAE